MVMLADETGADPAAVRVSVELPPGADDAGVSAAVTPAGSPEAASATLPVKPPTAATLILVVAEEPAARVKAGEAAARVKPAAAVKPRFSGVAPVTLPLEPVTAKAPDDAAAEAAAVSFNVAVPPMATVAGEKAAVTPTGRPETPSVTVPVKAPFAVTFTDVVADAPAASATDAGLALMAKPAAVTLRPIGAVPVVLPLEPVMLMLEEDTPAEADAVSVSVEVAPGATVAGEKAAVTPAGRPETASVTLPAKPLVAATLTEAIADAPLTSPSDVGVALTVKPGAEVTFRLRGAVAVRLPLAPETVRPAEDTAAEADAVSFNVELTPAATAVGVNAAVTPLGRPETDNVTLPAKPLIAATLTGVEADVPAGSATGDGEALKLKAGTALTVRLNGKVAVKLPLVPVRVTVAEDDAAAAAAVSFSVAVPPAAIAVGEKAAVTPAGNPENASVTLPWNPPVAVTPMPTVTDDPAARAREDGAALRVNPSAAAAWFTVNVNPAMVTVPVRAAPEFAATE
jgi:hypothetical protein